MEEFSRFAGIEINYDKTSIFRIGQMRHTNAKYYTQKKLHWSDKPVKILGIWIHPDSQLMEDKNYGEVIIKIDAILKLWKHRKLSVIGKIEIINNLAASMLSYLFMMLPTPDQFFFKFIKGLFRDFLWDDKVPKIRWEKLMQK